MIPVLEVHPPGLEPEDSRSRVSGVDHHNRWATCGYYFYFFIATLQSTLRGPPRREFNSMGSIDTYIGLRGPGLESQLFRFGGYHPTHRFPNS